MSAPPRNYLVQRRLPGVQGQNGCWSDQAIVEASSAYDAVRIVASDWENHVLEGEWRAAPAPAWESFWPRLETTHVHTVTVKEAL